MSKSVRLHALVNGPAGTSGSWSCEWVGGGRQEIAPGVAGPPGGRGGWTRSG